MGCGVWGDRIIIVKSIEISAAILPVSQPTPSPSREGRKSLEVLYLQYPPVFQFPSREGLGVGSSFILRTEHVTKRQKFALSQFSSSPLGRG